MTDIDRRTEQFGSKLPYGTLERIITTLEMHQPPLRSPRLDQATPLTVVRAEQCTVSFYRYLYETVGGKWLWCDRRCMDDAEINAIVSDQRVEIWVLYVDGVPAGYSELDRRSENEVELAYFGLMPEFIGTGRGQPFADWSVQQAWNQPPRRVWVRTCNHDHPAAIRIYQRAGFISCHQETTLVNDPRLPGALPVGHEL